MSYGASHLPPPEPIDVDDALRTTEAFWHEWAGRDASCDGKYVDRLLRSLLTLKALTFTETGGMVASPTTSLPEHIGGERNWDYRYCWIRDATLTLSSFMRAGYYDEAKAWRDWLHRSLAGKPDDLQIMYGIAGERWLVECDVPWLSGYYGSKPVRVGNAAYQQLQLDVWGEMMGALHLAREGGLAHLPSSWDLQCAALDHLATIWREPDDGIWEVRGGRQHFVHSKVMAWLAFECASATLKNSTSMRRSMHGRTRGRKSIARVCEHGFSAQEQFHAEFRQRRTRRKPADDPAHRLPAHRRSACGRHHRGDRTRTAGRWFRDALSHRAREDGLPAGEGVFLPCSFWIANAYLMQGRRDDAEALLERLIALRNDFGLLSEEYDTKIRPLVGNFPQAFSHLSLVHAVLNFENGISPFAFKPQG